MQRQYQRRARGERALGDAGIETMSIICAAIVFGYPQVACCSFPSVRAEDEKKIRCMDLNTARDSCHASRHIVVDQRGRSLVSCPGMVWI